ncbi:MAG TPA: MFS transporter [Thermomicrobiales bacterium]|nr:MFS transporter [Thermomicrobiales bacterium]
MRLRWDVGLGRDLGLAFWAMTFFEATFGAYMGVWPLWIEELGAPIALVGLVLGSAGFIRPLVIGPSSWLTERVDRKPLMIAARISGIAGMVVAALAQAWPILFITVVLNAIGEMVFPLLQTYVAERAHEDRARAFSMIINVGPSVALMITPLLSGALIAQWGMRSAFVLGAITGLASILILSRMDLSLPRDEDDGEAAQPNYGDTFANSSIRPLFAVHGVTILSLAIGISLIPVFLRDTRGLDPALIATLGAGSALGTALFGLAVARTPTLSNSPMRAATISCAAIVAGLFVFTFAEALPLIALAFFLRGGMFATWAMILAEMGNIAPTRLRSRAFAVLEMLGGSAMSFGPIIASQLYGISPSVPIFTGAVLGGIMAVVMGWMQWRRSDHTSADTTAIPV